MSILNFALLPVFTWLGMRLAGEHERLKNFVYDVWFNDTLALAIVSTCLGVLQAWINTST